MAMKPVSDAEMQRTLKAYADCNKNTTHTAEFLGIARATLQSRLRTAARQKLIIPDGAPENPQLQRRLKQLEQELRTAREHALDADAIKFKIIGLADNARLSEPPIWVADPPLRKKSSPGVPTLFASDWHLGEIVDPTQIGGVNTYNMTIARQRARTMIETTINLLNNHMVNPEYPGIVLALGGDMVSGDIHEELSATNEIEIMPVVLEAFGVLSWCIDALVAKFGRVFVPCVGGNHGRNTMKIRNKGRNYTSFDWLIYCFLAKRFEADTRVRFFIPNGPDALYECAGRKYLLQHGDQFRGGDGLIGCLGPIIRGDHKKRSRNAQINMEYDTMMLGHFHQLMQLERVIVNGSLKGYDEYASSNNFGFERPRQALWITNPDHGITFSMPVDVDKQKNTKPKSDWVSWAS